METKRGYYIEQNIGAVERVIRVLVGFAMLGFPYFLLMEQDASIETWHSVLMILSIYPSLTGILGTDPLYRLINVKTCDLSERNQCGSFPFQVDALVGHNPKPENDLEHTLGHSQHLKT